MPHKRSRPVAKKVGRRLTHYRRPRDRRPRSGCSRLVSRRDSGPSAPKRATPPIYRPRKQQGREHLAKRPVLSLGRPTGPRRSAGRPSPSNPQAALLALPARSAAAASAAAWAARPPQSLEAAWVAASGHACGPRLPAPALAPQRLLIQPWGAARRAGASLAWRRQSCGLRQILSAICRL